MSWTVTALYKRRRIARERRAEEARWKALSGPVRIHFDQSVLDKKSGEDIASPASTHDPHRTRSTRREKPSGGSGIVR